MNRLISWFCKILLKWPVDRFLIKEVRGLENRPKGNFILATNHQSHLDQICTGYVCVPRRFHMIGQTEGYHGFIKILLYLLYFFAGVIPVNRKSEESRKKTLREAIKVLKKGDILIIYPEGTRTKTGQIQKAFPGIAKLHLITRVPILPVGIKGTFGLMPPGKRFPKIKRIVEINIGKPLFFKEQIEEAKNFDCQSPEYKKIAAEIAEKVMKEVSNLYSEL